MFLEKLQGFDDHAYSKVKLLNSIGSGTNADVYALGKNRLGRRLDALEVRNDQSYKICGPKTFEYLQPGSEEVSFL